MTDKEKELVRLATDWYKGKKVVDDQYYDQLEIDVKSENPNFNLFDHVNLDGETVNHKVNFEPLKKPQIDKYDLSSKSTQKLLSSLEGKGYVKTPKFSGCSVVIYYDEEGNLEDIITKSNDRNGKRKLKSLNEMVPKKVTKGIRALNTEAVVELDKGLGYASESKANGLVNSKHKASEVRDLLTLIVWDLHLYSNCRISKMDLLKDLRKLSTDEFKVVDPKPFSVDTLEWDSKYISDTYSSLIDGYVIYSSNYNLVTALKFYFNESEEVTASIEWNLSNKLGLIPKITFPTIKLEGKNIKQCASNGIETLRRLNIGNGSKVVIARVNSTIPQVVSVNDPKGGFTYPKCPRCSTQLEGKDILKSVIYCSNPYCKDKLNWMTYHVGSVDLDKFEKNTDKYTIDAMNLSNFKNSNKRKSRWSDSDIPKLLEFISTSDALGYYEMIKSKYDLNNDNRKKSKVLIPSLLQVLKNKLNI